MSYSNKTRQLLDKLQLDHPLIQAPMIGVSNPQLAAAVASAGALGSLGLGGGSATSIESAFGSLTALTNRPINLNFFCHAPPSIDAYAEANWLNRLQPLFEELGASAPESISAPYGSFDDNPDTLQALLAHQAPVVSFHFGLPGKKSIQALHAGGCFVLATATSTREAMWLAANGADAIIAQGWEAGGHRGRFLDSHADEQLSTMALLTRLTQAVNVPVIAAGGINDGAGAAAALMLGAAAVQMGTAFVSCPEASTGSAYRSALTDVTRNTVMTPVFSGRAARGLANRVTDALDPHAEHVPDYPIAYDAGKALAAAAAKTDDAETIQNYAAMWAGQGFRNNRALAAAKLVERIMAEVQSARRSQSTNSSTGTTPQTNTPWF